MTGSEHVVFLWEDEKSKNQMILRILQSTSQRRNSDGLFWIEPVQIHDVENTLYENFYNTHKSAFLDKAVEQVSKRVSTNDGINNTNMPSKMMYG